MKIADILKYAVSLLLAGVLFYWVFKDISVDEFIARLSSVNYWWVVVSILLAVVSHWLRAYRWNLMLSPFGYQLKTSRTFLAVMSTYIANLAFPRLGEITRCGVIKKTDGVSMTTAIGTVMVERLIDVLILFSIIVLDFIIEFDKIYVFFLSKMGWKNFQDNSTNVYIGLLLIFVLGIIGIYVLKNFLTREFSHPTMIKISQKLNDLVQGFLAIRKVENFPGFIMSTLGIWVTYFLMSYVIFFSIPETSGLGLGAGLSILAAAGVAMAVPVQGGVGAYHALVSGVLVIYGIEATSGLFFATLLHTSQMIFIILVGGLSLILAAFISKKNQTDLGANSLNDLGKI